LAIFYAIMSIFSLLLDLDKFELARFI